MEHARHHICASLQFVLVIPACATKLHSRECQSIESSQIHPVTAQAKSTSHLVQLSPAMSGVLTDARWIYMSANFSHVKSSHFQPSSAKSSQVQPSPAKSSSAQPSPAKSSQTQPSPATTVGRGGVRWGQGETRRGKAGQCGVRWGHGGMRWGTAGGCAPPLE